MLYEYLWPNFCYQHLKNAPKSCSEPQGNDNRAVFIEEENVNVCVEPSLCVEVDLLASYIPEMNQRCDHYFCQKCREDIIRVYGLGEFSSGGYISHTDERTGITVRLPYLDSEEYEVICRQCGCPYYHLEIIEDRELPDLGGKDWIHCSNLAIPSFYFNGYTKQYFPFLKEHLLYCSENPSCSCYWPYISDIACQISDLVFKEGTFLAQKTCIKNLVGNQEFIDTFPYLIQENAKDFIHSSFIHTFFYSQYRQVLLSFAYATEKQEFDAFQVIQVLNHVYKMLDRLYLPFFNLYSQCLKKHPHPKIFYERGMLLFHQGNTCDSLDDIGQMVEWAEKNSQSNLLSSELYLKEGTIYAELGMYDKAVEALTKAIKNDPENKSAYLERAEAYFELGEFDWSLDDYLASGIKSTPLSIDSKETFDFSLGLTEGVLQGGSEAIIEFIPSLIGTAHGLGCGLWAFAKDPIQVSKDLVEATQFCIEFIKDNASVEAIANLVPELKELIEKWEEIDLRKRGFIAGHLIGKYGVDIFAGAGALKAMKAYRNLKRANNLLTYEALSISKRNKQIIRLEAARRSQHRAQILKHQNLKIMSDKQGKHIRGHKNFDSTKSELTYPNPQELVDKYAGTGQKVNKFHPGEAGYKERVDFERIIGIYTDDQGTVFQETTKGMIIYSKDGTHIVPTRPGG
ncbi:MAG: tetratricopeptide repeat protein [Chlamydiia bacterium]|nr:tetratricopeptide repeat protein [Chlamydiia bacterium]